MTAKVHASRKLWKVVEEPDGFYYELRSKGIIIARIKVEDNKTVKRLYSLGLI